MHGLELELSVETLCGKDNTTKYRGPVASLYHRRHIDCTRSLHSHDSMLPITVGSTFQNIDEFGVGPEILPLSKALMSILKALEGIRLNAKKKKKLLVCFSKILCDDRTIKSSSYEGRSSLSLASKVVEKKRLLFSKVAPPIATKLH
ncbi:hypothetical protein VNO77_02692 [Canavalia gladiata]|uniref:Uncharacterized protein n=1 Tax=Canavalia gladiata TaxID=3824 RepID=A0AAN9MZY0_CANGL